ncbi:MAG TPA: hypothetical protein VMT43_05890 [Acidimicrobiales bacterium]|nr:hypothetical protein [Acidimicrobiales bacterium]
MEQQDRVEQFKSEVADMRLRDPVSGRERVLLVVGVLLMIVGPAVAVFAYVQSHGTDNALQQGDDHTIALIGVCLTVVGAALFVRYSIGTLLRFWLARLSYEQHVQTDRLVDAFSLRAPVGAPETPPSGTKSVPAPGGTTAPAPGARTAPSPTP